MGRTHDSDASSGRVLSAEFLQKHTTKKDLIRRLRTIVEALSDADVEPNSPDYPGLGGLSSVLVEDGFLEHRDKEVRLHTVLACMQLLEVYAPEAPYDDTEVLRIFAQLIRQLANLAHCTSPSQANYQHYHHLLELLSDVKIGIILVELTKTLDNDSSPSRDEALEMLAELLKTILQCVHVEHPSDVADHAVIAVSAVLDEFEGILPIPIMDEILMCIAAGPVVMVTNPAAVEAAAAKSAKNKRKTAAQRQKESDKDMPPLQIQQTNPSYMVAAAIVRRSVDRISTPIANFLNGLLNGDPTTVEQTNISCQESVLADEPQHAFAEQSKAANVWTIIYELHRISPQILTTVIGTVTTSLQSPNLERRMRVTKLLGRLFVAPTSRIGVQFSPCYREWVKRSSDIEPKVRLAMVKYLVSILANKGREQVLAKDASDALVRMMESDPSFEVRLAAIHQVCDLAYRERDKRTDAAVPARLLQAVGNRVCSKNKTERRDALTGLAQIYYKYYVTEKLKLVESGGDDCGIEIITEALRGAHDSSPQGSAKKRRFSGEAFGLDEKYKWIPRRVFESACISDAADPEMRNRVVQVVDDVLLGGKKDSLSPTSRAVGLAFIMGSLRDDNDDTHGPITSNAHKWMCNLFAQRANLQRALGNYLEARAKLKETEQGTEEALATEAEAMERLELVASLSAAQSGSSSSPSDIRPILEKLHSARDKHIFRILATIASPDHSASARVRAFDELPKRTKSLGDSTAVWVKSLARRCAMGHFVNAEVIRDCVVLAQDCFENGDIPECAEFLGCIKTAVDIYPPLGGSKDAFEGVMELFTACRSVSSSKTKKVIAEYNLVTTLSTILSVVAPASAANARDPETPVVEIDSDLQAQLLNLCTRDGTPEQARHAVYTMAALLNPLKDSASAVSKGGESLTQEQQTETFGSLLKSLTLPSRLTCDNSKIVSILTALAALADCAPALFTKGEEGVGKGGAKAIKFALDACLLGRGSLSEDETGSEASDDEELEEMSQDEMVKETPDKRRRSRKGAVSKNMTPDGTISAVEDETLSPTCRRLCAAIEFLVSHIRHLGNTSAKSKRVASDMRIEQTFSVLCQVVEDGGLPPATRDRKECKARQDRAALRKCAATHLLRLCDARLKLEKEYLSPERWHVLAGSLLDDEKSVREGIMEELCMMLTGAGSYSQNPSFGLAAAPNLRFVAMVTLCTDVDHGAGHSGANANAANVGKRALTVKTAASQCISNLRKTCDATLAQCRSLGAVAEQRFESLYKMMIMPEYSVPYALHLLSFRRETPSAGGYTGSGLTQPVASQLEDCEEEAHTSVDEENQHKVLRKRLKWLFEPLVHSLGDGADNISFLLRMVDLLGNHYQPKAADVSIRVAASSPLSQNSFLSEGTNDRDEVHVRRSAALSAAKLKTACVAAREVLLSFVKKDVNLTTYPGAIQVPSALYRRAHGPGKISASQQSDLSARSSLDSTVSDRKRKSPRDDMDNRAVGQKKLRASRLSPTDTSRLNRDSLDSAASVGTGRSRRSAASLGFTDNSHRRNSRVHFSPDLVQGQSMMASQDASAVGSDNEGDVGFAEELSPIIKTQSPSPARSNTSHRSTTSEEKTLGTTPPSILRTAPQDDESDDGDLRLSMDSDKSDSTRGSRRSTRLALLRTQEAEDQTQPIQSEETMTTSETPLSMDSEEESEAAVEKRKAEKKEDGRVKKKSKKAAAPPAAIKIELNRGELGGSRKKRRSAAPRRGGRGSKTSRDEFDFPEDDKNKENGTGTKRRSRKKGSAPMKTAAQKTKVAVKMNARGRSQRK